MTKALRIPLDPTLKQLTDIPYTQSYVVKKRIQIDALNELPKEKRPPDDLIWNGTQDDIDEFLDKVFNREHRQEDDDIVLDLSKIHIEG